MKAQPENGGTGSSVTSAARTPAPVDLTNMDRDALAALVEGLFRWALRHTGRTRQQIIAEMRRDERGPP